MTFRLRHWSPHFTFVALLALGLVLAACSSNSSAKNAGSGGTTVDVTLSSFHVKADRASAPAGTITFKVTNSEATTHEFDIIKTDAPADRIPVKGDMADETNKIKELDDFQGPNVTKTLTINLQPGKYVLICNQPGHYQMGMHTEFTVE